MFYYKIGSYEDAKVISHDKEYSKHEFFAMADLCEDISNEESNVCIDEDRSNKFHDIGLFGTIEEIEYLLCRDYGFIKIEISGQWY